MKALFEHELAFVGGGRGDNDSDVGTSDGRRVGGCITIGKGMFSANISGSICTWDSSASAGNTHRSQIEMLSIASE
jgi:hypothetical protein